MRLKDGWELVSETPVTYDGSKIRYSQTLIKEINDAE